jgi:Chaperone of endosialidase
MAIKVQGTTVIDDSQGLRITGISTFTNGPVLVGSATSTGTASQPLQVTGDAYVSGNLGVGVTNPTAILDVGNNATTNLTAIFGADSNASTRTDATTKAARIGIPHYTSSEEPAAFLTAQSNITNNILQIGGGTALMNAATEISIYTALNNTTTTGTLALRIDSNQRVGIGTDSLLARLNVVPPASSGTIGALFSGTTSADMVRITQLGTGNALVVEDETNPDASPFVVTAAGAVGVGTNNPTSLLTVQGGGLFTGIITARNAVTQDSISLNGRAGGTSSFNLSLTPTTLGASRTVTFQDVSGTVYVSGGTDVTLADGGTNASLTAVNGGVVYSTSSAMAITAAGSAGQVLTSNGAASPTWSTLDASPITVCCTSNFLSCNTSATNIDTKSPPSNNFFLGCNAGSSIFSGSSNIFLGPNAGTSNQSGSNNVFLGCNSGCLITGGCNVVIGGFTGTGFVSCTNHIFLSDGAGNNRAQFNGSGAFGLNGDNYGTAGQVLTSGGNAASPTWSTLAASPITVCCTSNFLSCNTSATNIDTKSPPSNNLFFGCNAGSSIFSGSSNIFLGPNAGTSNQSGSNNVFLGCNSGCLITGGCNVVIGSFDGTGFVSCTNHIFLSDGAGNNRAQFNGSGAFGLNGANYGTAGQVLTSNGTAGAPTWQAASGGLTLTDDTSTNATRYIPITSATSGSVSTANVSSTKLQFNPSTGNLSATQFTSLSDVTQKTNIHPIETPIELTKQLQGVRFNWIDNNKSSLGLIAQEVEKVLPELVEDGDDDLKRVNYSNMIGLLIEAIKEQQVRIEELERKLNA